MKKVILEKRVQEGWEEEKRKVAKSDTDVHDNSKEIKEPNVDDNTDKDKEVKAKIRVRDDLMTIDPKASGSN